MKYNKGDLCITKGSTWFFDGTIIELQDKHSVVSNAWSCRDKKKDYSLWEHESKFKLVKSKHELKKIKII